MALLFFGIALLLGFMALVMGAPLVFFLKRDRRWLAASPRTDALWFN